MALADSTIEALAADLWQFCLDYYQRPSVEASCLALQNTHQGNVNILLFLLWYSGSQRKVLESTLIEQLQSLVNDEAKRVERLRSFRKNIDKELRQDSTQLAAKVKAQFLKIELELEKQVQWQLLNCLAEPLSLKQVKQRTGELDQAAQIEKVAIQNTSAYLQTLVTPMSDALKQLQQNFIKHLISLR